jgi:predicted transcriptional regulator
MVRKKGNQKKRLLTDVELELMSIVWDQGESKVKDILAALPPGRPLAYTSVSTILRILEKKGVLASRKEGRAHVYYPLVAKSDYEVISLQHLVNNVFSGTPSSLVRCLLDQEEVGDDELERIYSILETRRH